MGARVLGQIGEHVEPIACTSCGKSASTCGRSPSFCCRDCAGQPGVYGTSFLTHDIEVINHGTWVSHRIKVKPKVPAPESKDAADE